MKTREATPAEVAWLVDEFGDSRILLAAIGGPEEGDDVIPCPTVIQGNPPGRLFHVARQLDEIEVAALAHGGTLWLTCWGGLPVHLVHVQQKDGQ